MTYRSSLTPLMFTSLLALGFAGCDGDLGKDDAGDSGANDGGSGTAGGDSGGVDSADSADSAGTAGGSSGAGSDGGVSCDPEACGPAPGADVMCPDGSSAGWSCLDSGQGCSWQADDCPVVEPCTDAECGPAPGAPNVLCPDGVNYSGPGPCERNDQGVCAWTFVDCPACCDPAMLPDCPEPITCCGDGSWVCGEAGQCPGGETALECADGGTGGGLCADENDSCAGGETCCAGLTCCAGVPVPPGQEFCGMECPMSDVNLKENFATLDVHAVLDKVTQLDILTWNYKSSPDVVRHVGPMAQDFKAAFEVGSTDKAIFQVDADGVALASIQALDAELEELRRENAELEKALAELTKRVNAIE